MTAFFVIPRGCDFFFSVFGTPNQKVFQNFHKTVILSEAPRGSIALTEGLQRVVEGPRECLLAMLFTAFRPPKR